MRRSFSLAEMMIALALLAMGLLVIGAALPIGIRYTRDSVDMATGDAAGQYALKVVEQSVCLFGRIADGTVAPKLIREPGLFSPRYPLGTGDLNGDGQTEDASLDAAYVPIVKVRPLFARNIAATPGAPAVEWNVAPALVEDYIGRWLTNRGVSADEKECDSQNVRAQWPCAALRPALSSVSLVYPPITPDTPFLAADFFAKPYDARAVWPSATHPQGAETVKARERRVSWTAFYRRVQYDNPATPEIEGDRALYEFVVVVTRLPSERHRFPVQKSTAAGGPVVMAGRSGSSSYASGQDTAMAIPWLVTFDGNQTNPLPVPIGGFLANGMPQGTDPATLQFKCTADADGLFPVGTIFIPARNDDPANPPPGLGGNAVVGFGPPAPTVLPIYEVTERPDAMTVVTKFNGYYPRDMTTNAAPLAKDWPVWVIPPAFERLDGPGNPVFSDRSPVVAVARRYIRLREVP